jgi:hypothetical protein
MSQKKVKESAENEVVDVAAESAAETQPKRRSSRPARGFVKFINVFDWFDKNHFANNMPFILFLTMLVIGYIANSYNAERIIRNIDKTKVELKEKNAEFISTRSQLMFKSKQSEVARAVSATGVFESKEPPKKLFVVETKENKQD